MEAIAENYSRFKGSSWFSKIKDKTVLLIGCGGIGTWLSVLLARVGVDLYIFDEDIVEAHNQSGQLFRNTDIGSMKVDAISRIIPDFCDRDRSVEVFQEMYTEYSASNPIVLCGLDNMIGRKVAFENWVKYVETNPDCKNEAILIDGRLNAEKLQIFCIKGTDLSAQEEYRKNYLFKDSEVEEQECTFKQTSHMAAMIAGHMVGFLTNFFGEEFRDVPFCYEYVLPINMTNNDRPE